MVTIHIHDDELASQLQALASSENRSMEAILQEFLEEYLAHHLEQKQALSSMDGMFDDNITNLSTTIRETIADYYKQRDESSD